MAEELPNDFTPDDVGDMVDDPVFQQLPFAERQRNLERALGEASTYLAAQEDWGPEVYREFGDFANRARARVTDSETLGEKAKSAGGTVLRTIGDSVATAGTMAADAIPFMPTRGGFGGELKVPFENVGQAFLNNVGKLVDSGFTAVRQGLSDTDEALEGKLQGLRAEIDQGNFPFEQAGFESWVEAKDKDLRPVRESYFAAQRGMKEVPSEEADYAARSGLKEKQNQALLGAYMRTRSEEAWNALRDNLLKTRGRVQLESQEKDIQGGKLGTLMDDVFGEGASRYLTEAGDPFEVAGMVFAPLKGAKAVKAAGALKKGAELAKGVAGEVLSEQGSLFMDNPNATAGQRLQVAKDAAIGALGLAGLGAGAQAVVNRFHAPEGVDAATAPVRSMEDVESTGQRPVLPVGGVLQQLAERQAARAGVSQVEPGEFNAGTGPVPLPAPGTGGMTRATGEMDPRLGPVTEVLLKGPATATADVSEGGDSSATGLSATGTEPVPVPAKMKEEQVPMEWPKEEKPVRPTTEMHAWADKVIKESRSRLNTGIDPTVVAAYAVKGAALISRGYRTFKEWGAKMVETWGKTVKPHLQGVWSAAMKTSRTGAIDIGQGGPLNRKAEDVTSGNAPKTASVEQATSSTASAQTQPTMQERRWGKRFREDERVREEIKQRFGVQMYQPIPNVETMAEVNAIVNQQGVIPSAMMVMDPKANLAPRVKVMLAGNVIAKLNQAGAQAVQAQQYTAAAEYFDLATEVAMAKNELGTELGQGVQAFATWNRMTPEGVLMDFEQRARENNKSKPGEMPKIPDEMLDRVSDLVDEINKLPEDSVVRVDAMRELLTELSMYEGIPVGKLFWAYWYANVLSGLSTQGINVAGSGIHLMARAASLAATGTEPTALFRGMLAGQRQAFSEFANVLKGYPHPKLQERFEGATEMEQLWRMRKNALELTRNSKGQLVVKGTEKRRGPVREVVVTAFTLGRFIIRLINAADAYFWRTAKEGMAHVAAQRWARSQAKARGGSVAGYVAEALSNRPGEAAAARAQAEQELRAVNPGKAPKEADVQRRAWQIMEVNRVADVKTESERFADVVTFANPPEGWLGAIAKFMAAMTERGLPLAPGVKVQVMKFVLPFINIGFNVLDSAIDFSGIGILRGGLGKRLFSTNTEPFSAIERRHRMGAGIIGLGSMAMLGGLAAQYADEEDPPFWIFGWGPTDPALREQMRNRGWKPYSIKLGNKYYSYAETPFALGFSMLGGALDFRRFQADKWTEAGYGARLYNAMSQAPFALSQMGVFKTVGDLLESGSSANQGDPDKALDQALKSALRPIGGLVPGQGLLRDITKVFDPQQVEPVSMVGYLTKDIPVLRQYGTRPLLDEFGRTMRVEGVNRIPGVNRFITEASQDPDRAWLQKKRLKLPGIPRSITVPNAAVKGKLTRLGERRAEELGRKFADVLTDEEAYAYEKRAGERTLEVVKRFRKMDEAGGYQAEPELLQRQLETAVRAARMVARAEVLAK